MTQVNGRFLRQRYFCTPIENRLSMGTPIMTIIISERARALLQIVFLPKQFGTMWQWYGGLKKEYDLLTIFTNWATKNSCQILNSNELERNYLAFNIRSN